MEISHPGWPLAVPKLEAKVLEDKNILLGYVGEPLGGRAGGSKIIDLLKAWASWERLGVQAAIFAVHMSETFSLESWSKGEWLFL